MQNTTNVKRIRVQIPLCRRTALFADIAIHDVSGTGEFPSACVCVDEKGNYSILDTRTNCDLCPLSKSEGNCDVTLDLTESELPSQILMSPTTFTLVLSYTNDCNGIIYGHLFISRAYIQTIA